MRESTADLLVNPHTLQPLHLQVRVAAAGEVLEGVLCDAAGTAYSIRDGIPEFVPEEVTQTQTVRSFSQKWGKHRYYRQHTNRFYTDWYLQRYGFGHSDRLSEFLRGMTRVLDAGTGAGRDAANLAAYSSAAVFGVDTSREALETARDHVDRSRIEFIRADLNCLPFPDEFFDLINCDQVIHHTPSPRETFANLNRKLKPGGWICCYVYRRKAPIREFSDDYVRQQISRLPIDDALRVCEGITRLGQALADSGVTVEVPQDIPVLGLVRGRYDLQRFVHWNLFKCFWNEDFDFFTNNIVNFDWYHPEYCYRFEPDEFRSWFDEDWTIETWDVQEAGISCRARKR